MNFWQIIKYDLKNLTFDGRASRKEFIYYKIFRLLLGALIILFVILPPLVTIILAINGKIMLPFWSILTIGIYFCIACLILSGLGLWLVIVDACVSIRRLHDFNYSGWIYLIFFATAFIMQAVFASNIILMFGLSIFFTCIEFFAGALIKGTDGENDYGGKFLL